LGSDYQGKCDNPRKGESRMGYGNTIRRRPLRDVVRTDFVKQPSNEQGRGKWETKPKKCGVSWGVEKKGARRRHPKVPNWHRSDGKKRGKKVLSRKIHAPNSNMGQVAGGPD